jgi:hypothetical protein
MRRKVAAALVVVVEVQTGQGIAPWSHRGTSSSAMEAASSWKGCADEGIWPPEK